MSATFPDEPDITINGVKLTAAEAMTVRVAISNFWIDLQSGLGDDKTGIAICEGYKRCLSNISKLLVK